MMESIQTEKDKTKRKILVIFEVVNVDFSRLNVIGKQSRMNYIWGRQYQWTTVNNFGIGNEEENVKFESERFFFCLYLIYT